MGYDMSWAEEPEAVGTAKKAAYDDLWPASYDREAILRYLEVRESAGSYFRLNIWGMGSMRELLYAGSSIAPLQMPDWPDATDGFELRDAYEEACAEIRDADTGGVLPAFKVGSNDGWLVTPTECLATAMTWFEGGGREQARELAGQMAQVPDAGWLGGADQVLGWADEFVLWMGEAAGHGGFRVW